MAFASNAQRTFATGWINYCSAAMRRASAATAASNGAISHRDAVLFFLTLVSIYARSLHRDGYIHAGTCVDSEELFSLGTVRRFQSSRMYMIAAASMAT